MSIATMFILLGVDAMRYDQDQILNQFLREPSPFIKKDAARTQRDNMQPWFFMEPGVEDILHSRR
jgi:hypothetical protein